MSKYDPDALRFYLTATAPETRDTEAGPACPEHSRGKGTEGFSWEDFVERNNWVLSANEGHELMATHSLRSVQAWTQSDLPAGQTLREPAPLLKKPDVKVIEEEYARLEG